MGLLPLEMLNNPQKMLSLVSQRQEALSDNLVNIHTPGYKRKDVNFSQYLSMGQGGTSSLENKTIEKFGPAPIASSNAGSTESLNAEDELALMQQNYLLYNVAVRHLSSTITQIKTALNVSANS